MWLSGSRNAKRNCRKSVICLHRLRIDSSGNDSLLLLETARLSWNSTRTNRRYAQFQSEKLKKAECREG